MTILRLTAVAALGLLVACGGIGSLNPFGWFGGQREERVRLVPQGGFGDTAEDRGLVAEVTDLAVEPTIGGGVIRATGLPPVQGYWDAELVSASDFEPDETGVLALDFRIRPPVTTTRVSVPRSREVTAAVFVSRQKLDRVREIRVTGIQNARSVRR